MNVFRDLINFRQFRRLNASDRSIVFYSESGQDWHHFEPIIKYLTKELSRTVCYVTSDKNDPGMCLSNPRLLSFCIEEGFFRTLFFQILKADVMVLTMLDLHNFELKRSIHPVHYIYMWHGMGSTHMVDHENSYDHYDSIFCVGPHQVREIRRREEIKQLAPKNLVKHGYARVEQLMQESDAHPLRDTGERTVLIAPTWGEHSIINFCGKELISVLLRANFKVILRPHYHTLKLTPKLVDELVEQFKQQSGFKLVAHMGEKASLFESHLMICDWSAAAIEYAFGLEKPVLFIDVPRRIRNPGYQELGLEPIEEFMRDRVGAILAVDELQAAPATIERLLTQIDQLQIRIRTMRDEWVFNLGRSTEIAAKEILKIAAQQVILNEST